MSKIGWNAAVWRSWLALPKEPEVLVAQYGALKRQMPLLYTLIFVNTAAVTYTHWSVAPKWLTIGFSGLLGVVCAWRIVFWMRTTNLQRNEYCKARHQLRRTIYLSAVLGSGFLIWSLLLDHYGGTAEHGHIALFVAVTVIGCIFCFVELPQAATTGTLVVTVPYLLYYVSRGNAVFTAMALNILLVNTVMIRVLCNSFMSFKTSIIATAAVAAKQRETEILSTENARLAHTDALTGLPNRRFFFSELGRRLADAKEGGSRLSVGVLDLDRFKPVNDTFGHALGDRLLAAVGERLLHNVGARTVVARLGGDEFGLIIPADSDVEGLGAAICEALGQPFEVDGHSVTIGCSGGFASFPEAGTTVHELFDRSDYALYHAKSASVGSSSLFSLEHETRIRSDRSLETALREADLATELYVVFQPILCTRTNVVTAVEALGRWRSAVLGDVSPERFIVTAERLGMMQSITLNLLGKALADFATLPESIGLSFNLSAHDIVSPSTIAKVLDHINKSTVDPKRIAFELTETSVMSDYDAAVMGIRALRELGIRVALDDFGTGYSSLSYLRQLPLDKVKVDRSFVTDINKPSGRNIVAAIVGLCRTLQLELIIEGVETEGQLIALQAVGCSLAQGYLFAKPMSVAELTLWCAGQEFSSTALPQYNVESTSRTLLRAG